ncbi:chaperone modulator CbpM [Paracoccus onubensis]|uniref:chaperone modulator CbpM n=1 Tax=Paracoccus onubensis TaxID=1675788 RepID=UPI002731FEFE|nr:chaperone modulator CbpM [Paracoccus onubensis]MDP0928657.1 chaperone modulator CbpM [Paracoccus onubensis]
MIYDETAVVGEIRRVSLTDLRFYVKEGWVRPARGDTGPVFDDLDVARLRLICDLRLDMDLSDDALPVVLSLLDQLQGIRRELHNLARAVDSQPEAIRRSVIAACQARYEVQELD